MKIQRLSPLPALRGCVCTEHTLAARSLKRPTDRDSTYFRHAVLGERRRDRSATETRFIQVFQEGIRLLLPKKKVLLYSMLFLFSFISVLDAQEYRGSISGRVTDPSKAMISQALITATGPQQTYTAKTDRGGDYTIPFVQPGTYTVTAEAPGFTRSALDDVIIDVAGKVNLPFTLKLGSVAETVSVEADQVGLNIADASGGTVMDPEKIQNLPLNGRQVYQLLALTPGVKFTTTTFGATGNTGTRGWDESNAYSISGQSGMYNQILLNGAPVSAQGSGSAGTWNISPSVDAVQEFKVMTITFDAQYGRVGGGVVNTILKSGTDHFHGTAYEFWRNSILEANSYQLNQQGSPREFHNQHQFGGTLGGLFLKNRGYFFFSYEGWREVQPGGIVTTVPTPDMYPDSQGNVNLTNYLEAVGKTGIYDPGTTMCASQSASGSCNTYTRSAFPNFTIPASRISPIGLKIAQLFPAPNRPGYVNNYVFTGRIPFTYNMPIARVDYNLSDATRIYGIFAWWSGLTSRNSNGIPGPGATGGISSYRSSLTQVIDVTHTFSSSRVGDIRVSFNRAFNLDPSGSVAAGESSLTAGDLGLNMPSIPTSSANYAPSFSLGDSYPSLVGNTVSPQMFETYDASPSFTQVVKQHNLHFGAEFSLYHFVNTGVGNHNGSFAFSTGFTQQNPQQVKKDGSVYADLLLGYPGSGSIQWESAPYESYNYFAAYIQDDWRAKSNLTFNLGLRWDTETSPRERHNRLLAGFCADCLNPISSEVNFPAGNLLPNGATMVNPILGGVQFASSKLSAYQNTFGLLQPKAGFSWALKRNMVLRGGWTLGTALGIELGAEADFSQITNYVPSPDNNLHPSTSFLNGTPYPTGAIAPSGASAGLLSLIGNSLSLDERNRKIPVVQQYSLGVQVSLPWKMVGNAGYLGAHTIDLRAPVYLTGLAPSDFQKGHDNPSYLDQQVKNPFYGVLATNTSLGANPTIAAKYLMVKYPQYYGSLHVDTDPKGFTNYNSMIASLEKRLQGQGAVINGLSFLTSFTWSKTLTANSYLNDSPMGLVDPHPFYGIDPTDRPWQLAFSGLYGLPIGKGGLVASHAHGLLGAALNEWQLDWIFQNQGGTPASYPNGYLYNCGTYNQHPQQRTYKSYFNNSDPSCWSTFPEYTAVTQQPLTTTIRNPYAQQTALGIEKKFAITEKTRLQFKAEAFNLTNTPIFAGASASNPQTAPTRNASVSNPDQPGAWSGFGTIGSTQQNFPRQVQLSAKLLF
jgi:hypothetical protein